MAALDGIALFDADSPTSGGAFLLSGIPKERLTAGAPGGWIVQAVQGGRYAVARVSASVLGYEETRNSAFRAAQQGLDLWAISRAADLAIRDAETEHITWWPEPKGQVLRVTNVVTVSSTIRANLAVTDAAGNVQPQSPVPPATWHESLRYFRLSQVTDDLFDAYRNLYLALESILDRIAPQALNATTGKPSEGEGAWFRRALSVAHSRVPLGPFAKPGAADPVQDLYDELYLRTRTALFHAKSSRPSMLPHSPGQDRQLVVAALERLARMYIVLAEKELATRSAMGGLCVAGFDLMTDPLKTRLRLHATDDVEVADPANVVINPAGGAVVDLVTRHVPELEERFLRSFLGVAEAGEISRLSRLTGVVATVDGKPNAWGSVEGRLTLDGVQRLEGQIGIRHRNAQLPKKHFGS